ncbi:hypothetical protein V6N11_038342 [Hibiscus sabdariffa]|uniref:Transmembrane protein n=1 Tax=Hibiscus sabdariffa TaxID=183260 RepID=A0ABR2SKC4_9ROSI
MAEMASNFKDLETGLENVVTTIGQPCGFAEGSDNRVSLSGDASNSGRVTTENPRSVTSTNVEGQESKDANENRLAKEKRKSLGCKKPPRPPKAPSLDAADHKLIREIAELARLKRARIEHMKALKKLKAASAKPTSCSSTSTSTSSNRNMFAMVFTAICCAVILFQGMSSGGVLTSFPGSPLPAGAVGSGSKLTSVLQESISKFS